MIGQIAVRVTADRANFPLGTLFVRAGSAANVAIIGVPVRAGVNVEAITLRVENVDGVTSDFAARALGGVWVVDIPAAHFVTVGSVSGGVCVFASGKGVDGETTRTWNIGVGNLEVLTADAETPAPTPGATFCYVRLHATAPATPHRADAYIDNGALKIYNGTEWTSFGGSSVEIDTTLTQQGAAADAKAVGDALRSGFTEWEFSDVPQGFSVKNVWYETQTPHGARWVVSYNESAGITMSDQTSRDATGLTFEEYGVEDVVGMTATRHAFPPTKTSQLTNDGAPNGGGNAYVMTNDTRLSDARTPTAHHATHAANGSDPIAPADIGAAAASDLPYALVTPGEWEFSDGGSHTLSNPYEYYGKWVYEIDGNGYIANEKFDTEADALAALFLTFTNGITATRASLPGHLCDRAGNRVEVSGETTLTLPAANPGYLRDFLVRLEISGSTVPTITFAAPTGETITYETDGDEFPVPDEAGTWLYSFTESCVAHKFAVSLKKVNTVAQGGS